MPRTVPGARPRRRGGTSPRSPQRDQVGLGLAVELARGLFRTSGYAVEGEVETVLDEAPPEPLDGAFGRWVHVSDLLVGPCGSVVGLVGGEEHEGALDRLGLLATALS